MQNGKFSAGKEEECSNISFYCYSLKLFYTLRLSIITFGVFS